MIAVSSAFEGCSDAYVSTHLANATCLDGRPHDGSPCLLTDEARAAEALELLSYAPPPIPGIGVVSDGSGRWALSPELRRDRTA